MKNIASASPTVVRHRQNCVAYCSKIMSVQSKIMHVCSNNMCAYRIIMCVCSKIMCATVTRTLHKESIWLAWDAAAGSRRLLCASWRRCCWAGWSTRCGHRPTRPLRQPDDVTRTHTCCTQYTYRTARVNSKTHKYVSVQCNCYACAVCSACNVHVRTSFLKKSYSCSVYSAANRTMGLSNMFT